MSDTISHGVPGCRTKGVDIPVEMIPYLQIKLQRGEVTGQGGGHLPTALDMSLMCNLPALSLCICHHLAAPWKLPVTPRQGACPPP